MAGRKPQKAGSQNNPSTVLIIFLVFFVLLSIGLGVWAYYGYQAAQKKEKQGVEYKEKEAAAKKGEEWFTLQALWAKMASGHELTKDEANALSTGLADLEKKKFDGEKEKASFDQMVKADKEALKWDNNAKKLLKNYRKELDRLQRENDQLKDEKEKVDGKLALERGEQKKRTEKTNTTLNEIQAETKKINRSAEETIASARTAITAANDAKEKLSNEYAADIRKLQDKFNEVAKTNAKTLKQKDEEIAMLKVRKEQLEAKEEKAFKTDLLSYDAPKGKIVRVDWTGKMPYINLGRADGVKEQLTFSIFGVDTNGKVDKEPKGNLEIVRIIDGHLSQGRIVSLRDSSARPLQEGDRLFNPAWDPNRKIHVAIAGVVDFLGDESGSVAERVRNLREFINNLERQNILVDAYIDMRDLSIKGRLTLQTDYFILANGPSYDDSKVLDLKDDKIKYNQKLNERMEVMRKDAAKKGISIIALNKFAMMTGYRIPRAARLSDPTSTYRTGVPTEREPPKKKGEDDPDKKADDKKKEDDDKKDDKKMEDGDDKKADKKMEDGDDKKDDKKEDKKKEDEEDKKDDGDKKDGKKDKKEDEDKKDGDKKDGDKKDGAKKDGDKKDGAKKDGAKKDGAKDKKDEDEK